MAAPNLMALREVYTKVTLFVANAVPLFVSMRPGAYTRSDRLVSVDLGHATVIVTLTGTPEQLRAWAEQVVALADGLAVEADELADSKAVR